MRLQLRSGDHSILRTPAPSCTLLPPTKQVEDRVFACASRAVVLRSTPMRRPRSAFRERPSSCAAEKCDELAPPHCRPLRLRTVHRIALDQCVRIKLLLSDQRCPLWVKSRHSRRKKACPLYPRKRTSISTASRS